MSDSLYQFLQIDFPAMTTGILAAISCGILGNFLVLRRMSLMGDAISHAVLPGLVVAFLISSSRATIPMFIGAGVFGLLTVFLVEVIRKLGRLETGVAMGVVFSILFALGVLLLEQAAARTVDLDADCVLYGQMEHIFWFPPKDFSQWWQLETLALLPKELGVLAVVTLLSISFILIFYKELKISAFDPDLATSLGIKASTMHYSLMIMVAAAVVASFVAVGSILVIAMLICPAATARLLTDRLSIQIWLSVGFAAVSGFLGYIFAAFGPFWLGWENSVSASGMITVMAGFFLMVVVIFSPSHGVIAKQLRQFLIGVDVAREDLIGFLYRLEEMVGAQKSFQLASPQLLKVMGKGMKAKWAVRNSLKRGQVKIHEEGYSLTPEGRRQARSLVRTHRLWETFLVKEMGLKADHVHPRAEDLEHFTSESMVDELSASQRDTTVDPHGRKIPNDKL